MFTLGFTLRARLAAPHSELPHLPPFPRGKESASVPAAPGRAGAQHCLSEAARVLFKKRTDDVFILETTVASFQGGIRVWEDRGHVAGASSLMRFGVNGIPETQGEIRKMQVFRALTAAGPPRRRPGTAPAHVRPAGSLSPHSVLDPEAPQRSASGVRTSLPLHFRGSPSPLSPGEGSGPQPSPAGVSCRHPGAASGYGRPDRGSLGLDSLLEWLWGREWALAQGRCPVRIDGAQPCSSEQGRQSRTSLPTAAMVPKPDPGPGAWTA